jgi:predicted MFS family arabinose efflux permease
LSSPTSGRWAIALAGAISLATAMGIGRFAFTPLLPMMLHDGVIDLHGASWLASANYLGYLIGALLCTLQPWFWARLPRLPAIDAAMMLRGGLVATVLLTLGMSLPLPALWPLWRGVAGVASAFVFVYTSGWCLAQLAQRDAGALGGVIFTGPGAGIVVSGLFASAMVQWHWRAATGWAILGVLAFLLTALVWRIFRPAAKRVATSTSVKSSVAPSIASSDAPSALHGRAEVACLAIAYGLAGLGYIVTATFLPVIARQSLPGSPWLDLFWPVFGLGTMVGALLATRLPVTLDMRKLLAVAYVIQAAGIGVGRVSPSLAGFAIGSLLLGLPFTAITLFAMQEVRRLRPLLAASTMGLLTAVYGLGQIGGPPMVALLLARSRSAGEGFTLALEIAMGGLLLGATLYGWMLRAYPMARSAR